MVNLMLLLSTIPDVLYTFWKRKRLEWLTIILIRVFHGSVK